MTMRWWHSWRRYMLLVPAGEAREGRMPQRTLQIAEHARQVAKILRLAVALVEPRENTQDFGRTLHGERRIKLGELRHVEGLVGDGTRPHITADQVEFQPLGHVHARILKQRGKVIGRRPE